MKMPVSEDAPMRPVTPAPMCRSLAMEAMTTLMIPRS